MGRINWDKKLKIRCIDKSVKTDFNAISIKLDILKMKAKRTIGALMSLEDTMDTIGHYAKNTWNAVKMPLAYVSAAAIILTTFNANEAKAQDNFKNTSKEITETGYGTLFIKDENNQGIEGATITWTPVSIPGDSIPNPYTFITTDEGLSDYEVLVFHDTGVAVQNNYNIEVVQTRPNPSRDFTFNFIANERPNDAIKVSDVKGSLVGRYNLTEYNNHVAVYHVDLSDKASGIYFATTTIDGKPQVSKLVKINGVYSGNLGSSAKPILSNFKSTQENEAIYDIIIEAEGYFPLTDQRIVTEGDNGWSGYTLISDEPAPIDNQDLAGIVTDLNNNYAAISGAIVEAFIPSLNQTISTTSASDGSFVLEGVPLDTYIEFSAGGIDDKYSIVDFPFTTISEVVNPADSVWSYFDVVLPDELPASTTLAHAKDQNTHGTNQDTILFYLGNSFNTTEKNWIKNSFITLQADENNSYIFAERFTPLNNTGISIEYGTYNTQTYEDEIITPLGNTLYPGLYANSTMGVGDYVIFVHEVKRALGFKEVAWPGVESVMEANPGDYTLEDKDISVDISRPYWNAVYQDGKTHIPMGYLAEDMNSKKSNSSNVKDVKARIDELNEVAEQKIVDENIPDYFNSSSSYGNFEVNYSQARK